MYLGIKDDACSNFESQSQSFRVSVTFTTVASKLEQMNAFTMKLSPPHNKSRGVYNNLGFVFTILVQYLSQNYKHENMMSDIFLNTKTDDTLCTYTATRERQKP